MIACKFGIGQQVRHRLLGYLGVVVDIDPEYTQPAQHNHAVSEDILRQNDPWYHVVMVDGEGQTLHCYLAEVQLSGIREAEHPEQPSLDDLAMSIRARLQSPELRH